MKLLFKQRFFSWFDSYNIYDENGDIVFEVKGKLSWGHLLNIYDNKGQLVGIVKEKVLTFLPKFEIYENDKYLGNVKKEFTLIRDKYFLDFKDWKVEGDILGWNYLVVDGQKHTIMETSKKIFNLTDTYILDIPDEKNKLYCLMIVLAIDAAKCSKNKG